ncbi:hypothetical protein LV75_002444 [Actinokineospora diospyrosa]|uniref:BNR repeat protein n=1 Tax=Actinokineospora diospyrosa TaxID=103728 RepID=A0ABT1IBL2_9PSEU|nr:hypothetical protein [Actinokineospora diospyrosa]
MRASRRFAIGGVVLALAAFPQPAAAGISTATPLIGRTTFLPTGDKVTVVGGPRTTLSVDPAPGREKLMFHSYRTKDHFYVIPEDVLRRTTADLDLRRFDLAPASTPPVPGDLADLTITLRDTAGRLTGDYSVAIVGLDNNQIHLPYDSDGSLTIRLPKGRYFIDSVINTTAADGTRHAHILPRPNLVLDRDTTVDTPAVASRPIRVTPPDPRAELALGEIGFNVVMAHYPTAASHLTADLSAVSLAQLGPSLPPDALITTVNTQWTTPAGDFYGLAWFPRGTVPTGFTKVVRREDLATVHADLNLQVPGDAGIRQASPNVRSEDLLTAGAVLDLPLPTTRTEYYNFDDTEWLTVLYEVDPANPWPARAMFMGGVRTFLPGRTYRLPFNHAPFGPAFPAEQRPWAVRDGDTIDFFLPLLSDSAANAGISSWNSLDIELSRNGSAIGHWKDTPSAALQVPPGAADYHLTARVSRSAPYDLSTQVSAEWTFRSTHTDREVALPLSAIRYFPALDAANTAPAGVSFLIPIALQAQSTDTLTHPRHQVTSVSYDEGQTWQKATAVGNRAILLRHPASAASVSLRTTATTPEGGTVAVTLIRAYKLRPR